MTNERIRQLYAQGYSLRDIARLANESYQSIHQKLTTKKSRRAGVMTRDPHWSSPEESEVIKKLYVIHGLPAFEIAAALFCSDMMVHRRLLKMGVRTRTPAEARDVKRLPLPEDLIAQVERLRKARLAKVKRIELTKAAAERP